MKLSVKKLKQAVIELMPIGDHVRCRIFNDLALVTTFSTLAKTVLQ